MTQATFDEMDPILGSRADIRPPLTINAYNTGYADFDTVPPLDDDEITVIQEDDTDTEGSQRGKKKRKTRTNSNELLEFLKQKWDDDKEAEAIIRAENLAARKKHLDLMERNTEASCSIAESFKIMAERMN
jgi:hypothetical protein